MIYISISLGVGKRRYWWPETRFPMRRVIYLERLVRPDEDGPLTDEQQATVLANTYACAPSFEAFIYRWWFEATIYMKLNEYDSAPLTEEERRYLAHSFARYWPK